MLTTCPNNLLLKLDVLSYVPKGSVSTTIPNPFPIPVFRDHTQSNLTMKRLADDDRKYIVRVLAIMLSTYTPRPSMKHCEIVAKSLVTKYGFLKEHVRFVYTCNMWS